MVSKRSRRQWLRLHGPLLRRAVIVCLTVASFPFLTGFGDTPGARNRRGNAHYRAEEYDEALSEYRSGQIVAPELEELAFNSGNALYRMGEFDSALREYLNATASFDDELSAMSYYNAGNAELSAGDLEAALESFKQSLRRNPGDLDAKYNLEVALALLEERENQEQSDQGQEGDQGDQEQEGDQQQEGDEQTDDQGDQEQEGDQSEEKNEEPEGDQEEQDGGQSGEEKEQSSDPPQGDGEQDESAMSEEDAERLLDAIDRGERELQAELRAARARKREKVDKDW